MDRPDKYLSIIIFLVSIVAFSTISGYQYIGDLIEKILNTVGMFANYFVLIALFSVYKGVSLFSYKQLIFMAFFSVFMTILTYLYPYFKYSDQDPSGLMSTFVYDMILNVLIFTILFKEAKHERSKRNI